MYLPCSSAVGELPFQHYQPNITIPVIGILDCMAFEIDMDELPEPSLRRDDYKLPIKVQYH